MGQMQAITCMREVSCKVLSTSRCNVFWLSVFSTVKWGKEPTESSMECVVSMGAQ